MKKDFSQPFEQGTTRYELLVQHAITKKFYVITPTEPDGYELDWYDALTLELPPYQPLTAALAQFLYERGLALNSYRELAQQTDVGFSFVDETPGSEAVNSCLLVTVDIVDQTALEAEHQKLETAELDELLGRLHNTILRSGIARLMAEARELS